VAGIPAMLMLCTAALVCAASVYVGSTSAGGASPGNGAMYAAASCVCFFLCSSAMLAISKARCPNGCDNLLTGR
jgi:hypothetical protein